jgi:hypothetical protein
MAAGAIGVVSTSHGRILDTVIVGAATSLLSMLTDAVLLKLLGEPEPEPEPAPEKKP